MSVSDRIHSSLSKYACSRRSMEALKKNGKISTHRKLYTFLFLYIIYALYCTLAVLCTIFLNHQIDIQRTHALNICVMKIVRTLTSITWYGWLRLRFTYLKISVLKENKVVFWHLCCFSSSEERKRARNIWIDCVLRCEWSVSQIFLYSSHLLMLKSLKFQQGPSYLLSLPWSMFLSLSGIPFHTLVFLKKSSSYICIFFIYWYIKYTDKRTKPKYSIQWFNRELKLLNYHQFNKIKLSLICLFKSLKPPPHVHSHSLLPTSFPK